VQKYVSKVLVVVPPAGFSEETLRHARASLFNVHVGTWSVSTETEATVVGRMQDEFLVDGALADANIDDFAGVLFAAGEGDRALAENETVLALARSAREQGKLLAAWGTSVAILARARVIKGLAVTGTERWHDLPDIPTMLEAGYKDFVFETYTALLAPEKTPAEIVSKLEKECLAILNKPAMREKLVQSGFQVQAKDGKGHMERVKKEVEMFRGRIRQAGIKIK